MQCPVDGTQLQMTERSGVEIDYCPQCRGVWLDRGELDKIVERAIPPKALHEPVRLEEPREPRRAEFREDHRGDHRRRDHDDDDDRYGKKRKKSLLGDIFDF